MRLGCAQQHNVGISVRVKGCWVWASIVMGLVYRCWGEAYEFLRGARDEEQFVVLVEVAA